MSAKDYRLCISELTGTIYISKISKRNSNLMTNDRVAVSEEKFIDAIVQWAKLKLNDDDNVLHITENDEVVAKIVIIKK